MADQEWLQFSDGGECFLPAGVQFYGVAHKPIIDIDDDDRPDESYCTSFLGRFMYCLTA